MDTVLHLAALFLPLENNPCCLGESMALPGAGHGLRVVCGHWYDCRVTKSLLNGAVLPCCHDRSSLRARFCPPFNGQSAELGLQSKDVEKDISWWLHSSLLHRNCFKIWLHKRIRIFFSSFFSSFYRMIRWSALGNKQMPKKCTHTWSWHCFRRKPKALANISRANWTALPCDGKRQYLSVAASMHSRKAWWPLHMFQGKRKSNHIQRNNKQNNWKSNKNRECLVLINYQQIWTLEMEKAETWATRLLYCCLHLASSVAKDLMQGACLR